MLDDSRNFSPVEFVTKSSLMNDPYDPSEPGAPANIWSQIMGRGGEEHGVSYF